MKDGRLEKTVVRGQLGTAVSDDGRDPDNACVAMMWQYAPTETQWQIICETERP